MRPAARSPASATSWTTAPSGVVLPKPVQQDVGVPDDSREQIVEIVRDSTGQEAHGFHPLGLSELLLKLVLGGDVLDHVESH